MAVISLVGSKIILASCNFLLLASGFILTIGGMLVLFDTDRVILSKLLSTGQFSNMPHPFLYYASIGLSLLGLVLAATGILGCWASCLHNYWLLTIYFIIVLAVLIGESAIYTIAWAWPSCMGIGLETEELVRALQSRYGSAGQEQFTAAMDLAQTTFGCCGIDSANEYDTSLWRLQALGPSFAVPLSCCRLTNENQTGAYLNPEPVNTQLCQALEKPRHQGFRHTMGCKDSLDQWYTDHYVVFLVIGFIVTLIEFLVLLSSILSCTRIYHHNQQTKSIQNNIEMESEPSTSLKDTRRSAIANAYSNETYAVTDSFRKDYDRP